MPRYRRRPRSFFFPGRDEAVYTPATSGVTGESRTFPFAGYDWFGKNGGIERLGPGGSLFDDENIELGNDGSIRLYIRDRGVVPVGETESEKASAEMWCVQKLGYGKYEVVIEAENIPARLLSSSFWNRAVFGFFNFDVDFNDEANEEIDIELGTFDGFHAPGGVFSNFNNTPQQLKEISTRLIRRAYMSMEWFPDRVEWVFRSLDQLLPDQTFVSYDNIPQAEGGTFILNFWQFQNDPDNEIPDGTYITLRDFKFTPNGYGLITNDQPVTPANVSFDTPGDFVTATPVSFKRINILGTRWLSNVRIEVDPGATDIDVGYVGGAADAGLNGDIWLRGGELPVFEDYFSLDLTFNDETRTELPLLIKADQGVFPVSLPVTVTSPSLDITVEGAELAAGADQTYDDPIDLTDAATWIHVGVIGGGSELTNVSFEGTTAGVTFAYPGGAFVASLANDTTLSVAESDYFAVNVTAAATAGQLDFTMNCDQGTIDFTIGVV